MFRFSTSLNVEKVRASFFSLIREIRQKLYYMLLIVILVFFLRINPEDKY